jgi:hypothetical protein
VATLPLLSPEYLRGYKYHRHKMQMAPYLHEVICSILELVWCTIRVEMLVETIETERATGLARG